MSYSHMGTPTLPSALLHFTSEFGMESGGSTALLSLNKKLVVNALALTNLRKLFNTRYLLFNTLCTRSLLIHVSLHTISS